MYVTIDWLLSGNGQEPSTLGLERCGRSRFERNRKRLWGFVSDADLIAECEGGFGQALAHRVHIERDAHAIQLVFDLLMYGGTALLRIVAVHRSGHSEHQLLQALFRFGIEGVITRGICGFLALLPRVDGLLKLRAKRQTEPF